jgi:hypothetical protein
MGASTTATAVEIFLMSCLPISGLGAATDPASLLPVHVDLATAKVGDQIHWDDHLRALRSTRHIASNA